MAAAWDSDRGQQWSSNVWFGVIGVREDISPPPFAGWLNANPAWPLSSGPITLSVMSTDDGRPPGVELVWTRDGAAQTDLAMFDDGTHGDFAGGDSRYSVQVGAFPPLRNATIRLLGGDRELARRFERELWQVLRSCEVQTSRMAVSLMLVAATMLVAPLAMMAHRMPEIVRLLTDLLH